MKQRSKFSREQEETHESAQQAQTGAAREFTSADELLRFDAQQTNVPPGLAQRLQNSSSDLAPAKTPWWKRFF